MWLARVQLAKPVSRGWLGLLAVSLIPCAGIAETVLDEITVTARKRTENLQSVSAAVTAVSGSSLERIAASDISALQGRVPNLTIFPGRNQSTTISAFIRGIGQADPLWGVDPGVGLYFDDVFIARPQGALLDVFDVERVEVLRGPQGTLYGKNTIGGAIRYFSRRPTESLTGRLSAVVGDFDTREYRASLAGPVYWSTLRGKAAFASLKRGGYGRNLLTGAEISDKDSTSYRLMLEWQFANGTVIRLAHDRTDDRAGPKGFQRLADNPFCPLFTGAPCPPLPGRFDAESGLASGSRTKSEGYSLHTDWRASAEWQFRSITAYREHETDNNIDFDTTPARILDITASNGSHQFSQELQANHTRASGMDLLLGLYYFEGSAGGFFSPIGLEGLFNVINSSSMDTESFAAFADLELTLGARTTLQLGARYTREEKRVDLFNRSYLDPSFQVLRAVQADFEDSEIYQSLSPRIGLERRLAPDVLAYLTFSRGVRSGGFNIRANDARVDALSQPFDDETLDILELGLKSTLFGGRFRLNGALFYGDYRDVQVTVSDLADTDGDGIGDLPFQNFTNVAEATTRGVEFEFDWVPAACCEISGNLNYLDAAPDETVDLNGDGIADSQVITNAPRITGAVLASIGWSIVNGRMSLNLEASYRDESVLTEIGGAAARVVVQPSYTIWDAWIDWTNDDQRWRLAANVKNLGDEQYLTSAYDISSLGISLGSNGPPRTLSLTVAYGID